MTRRVNIVDPHQISGWLAAEQAEGDGTIAWWLEIALLSSLKKREESAVELKALPKDAPEWLVNKWDVAGPFHEFRPDAALADKVRHIKDWLVSAKLHDEDFLRDVDEEGRPKKLVQLDLEGAYNAADKYFERLRQKFGAVAADDKDAATVMSLDGGYRIVRLLTPEALRAEGAGMGHCIGGGAYDEKLVTGDHEYYSLRDPADKPHATFEVRDQGNALMQCKGKGNKPPVEKYMPMVRAFVKERKFALKEGPSYTGLMQDAAGSYHTFHFYPMPERLLRESDPRSGNLWQPYGAPHDLPDELTVKGAMSFGGCMRLEALPEGMKVSGYILTDHGVFTDVKSARAAFEAKFGKDAPSSAPKGPKV